MARTFVAYPYFDKVGRKKRRTSKILVAPRPDATSAQLVKIPKTKVHDTFIELGR
jgi:hypothetical protein